MCDTDEGKILMLRYVDKAASEAVETLNKITEIEGVCQFHALATAMDVSEIVSRLMDVSANYFRASLDSRGPAETRKLFKEAGIELPDGLEALLRRVEARQN